MLEKIFDDYGDPDETIDANVLVDMFLSADGSVDTNALMDFNREHESEESSSEDSDTPDGQMTLDDLADGSTGVLHPGMLFAVAGFAVGQLLVDRLRRELETLTAKPGTSLHAGGERMAKGAAAYSLFVGMVAFNLHALALIPGAVI